jgi:perosamine synthetase
MKKIPVSEPNIGKKDVEYINRAAKSGWVSSIGYYVDKFEKDFAEYCNRKHGVSTGNGTHALHLALEALGVGKGHEVIVPDFSFIATANTVHYTGAKPVFVDAEKDTWNLNPEEIKKKITPKTKAIMVVHLYGNVCDMHEISKIARKNKLFIVEDAAEAHGSTYKNERAGSFGDISCFSFYGNKVITTGEGGMCLTDNPEINDRLRMLRDHGMRHDKRYWHEVVGFNYRLTNLQAALGCAQLERIEQFLKIKRRNAVLYEKMLGDLPWIEFQTIKPESRSNYWMFTFLVKDNSKYSRNEIMEILKEKGIETRNVFHSASKMPVHSKYFNKRDKFHNSVYISERGLTLPSSTLLSAKEIKHICNVIKSL